MAIRILIPLSRAETGQPAGNIDVTDLRESEILLLQADARRRGLLLLREDRVADINGQQFPIPHGMRPEELMLLERSVRGNGEDTAEDER